MLCGRCPGDQFGAEKRDEYQISAVRRSQVDQGVAHVGQRPARSERHLRILPGMNVAHVRACDEGVGDREAEYVHRPVATEKTRKSKKTPRVICSEVATPAIEYVIKVLALSVHASRSSSTCMSRR